MSHGELPGKNAVTICEYSAANPARIAAVTSGWSLTAPTTCRAAAPSARTASRRAAFRPARTPALHSWRRHDAHLSRLPRPLPRTSPAVATFQAQRACSRITGSPSAACARGGDGAARRRFPRATPRCAGPAPLGALTGSGGTLPERWSSRPATLESGARSRTAARTRASRVRRRGSRTPVLAFAAEDVCPASPVLLRDRALDLDGR